MIIPPKEGDVVRVRRAAGQIKEAHVVASRRDKAGTLRQIEVRIDDEPGTTVLSRRSTGRFVEVGWEARSGFFLLDP